MERKKGIQLNQAFGAVLTLVLVAVLVIVAIVIFVSLNTSFAGTTALSEVNETVDMSSGPNSVANASMCGFGSFGIVEAFNDTTLLDSGNYTTTDVGLITNTTDAESGDWLVTWTGSWGSEACDAGEEITTEFGNYTSLIGLVGTIIFLGLVIGILIAAFAFGGRREV